MSALIDSGPYQLLNKDPTDRLTRKLSEKQLTLKRNGHILETLYNKIRPRHKQPPRMYGLPKIHKADTLLRPIVSWVNTFAYDLSAFLANVLSPLAGNSNFTVKNSTDLASIIASEEIQDHEIMASFDVESPTYRLRAPYKPRYKKWRTTQAWLTALHLHQFKSPTS